MLATFLNSPLKRRFMTAVLLLAASVIAALAAELEATPRLLDKQMFRGVANRLKEKTGQKGRALFHPIRIALTAAADGPELDLLVPAMERGAVDVKSLRP